MTRPLMLKIRAITIAILLALAMVGVARAETYYLRAASTTINLPGVGAVPMWGYALDLDNNLATVDGTVSIPGPPLTVTDGLLTIHLRNDLPEPTSLVIPGQNSLNSAPVFFVDGQGRQRVRSFSAEAPAGGGTQSYSFSAVAPGTYLYQSGSHASVQVSMGLYGALTSDAAAGQAYAGLNYDQDLTLVYSEVDIEQHQAVASGSYGTAAYPSTKAEGYEADYFLINGKPYTADFTPPLLAPGSAVLLRLLNAGLRERVPILLGPTLELLAEDGNPYPSIRKQTSINLPPGKTIDARFTAPAAGSEGYLSLFDRRLGLSDPQRATGGMLYPMAVGTPTATLHVVTSGDPQNLVETVSSPGGISCGSDCDENYFPGTQVVLEANPAPGQALSAWNVYDADPGVAGLAVDQCHDLDDCELTMSGDRWVEALFAPFVAVTILAPAAGEVISAGLPYNIRWAGPATAASYTVGYSMGPGTPWVTIAEGISEEKAVWQVPTDLNLKTGWRISVAAFDAAGTLLGSAETVAGEKVQDSLTLQAPNGGELLNIGDPLTDPYPISWSNLVASAPVAQVGLWYQLAADSPWQSLATLSGNPGSYDWALPALAVQTSTVRVGVALYDAAGNPLVMDTSDATFTLVPAAGPVNNSSGSLASLTTEPAPLALSFAAEIQAVPVTMLQPNGGEFIAAAAGATILFQAPEHAASYLLEYSTDDGKTFKELAADLLDQQYDWQIPQGLVGKQVLLQVTAFDAGRKEIGSDLSDASFLVE